MAADVLADGKKTIKVKHQSRCFIFFSYLCREILFDMDEKERIIQLRRELHEHNYRYYVLNQPTIGDQDFDFMMHELQQLEAKHPEMADENSPTQRVGSDLNTEFQQVEHKYPMLSLANTYNEQDVSDWYESVRKGLAGEDFEVCCEMKYDGPADITDLCGRAADSGRHPW